MRNKFRYKRLTTYLLIFATFFIAAGIKTATIMAKEKGAVLSIALLKKENGIPVDVIKLARKDFPVEIPMALVENEKGGYQSFVTPKMHSKIQKGRTFRQTGSDVIFEVSSISDTPDTNANLHVVHFTLIKGKMTTKGPIKGKLRIDQVSDALWVPSSSLKRENGNLFVYTIVDGVARKNLVEIGKENGIGVVITKGVKPGDLVAIRGLSELTDGIKVDIHENQVRL